MVWIVLVETLTSLVTGLIQTAQQQYQREVETALVRQGRLKTIITNTPEFKKNTLDKIPDFDYEGYAKKNKLTRSDKKRP